MSTTQMMAQMTTLNTELERLSDCVKLSAHVTRVLGQNPGLMTLQGTNSYLLQPPSNGMAPLILVDTSSPHTAQQYVDCLMTHLFHLGLESGARETHFESVYATRSLNLLPEEERDSAKAKVVGMRKEDPSAEELFRTEYGPHGRWAPSAKKERRLPFIEHIIITHRHLDHVGALPLLLTTLKEHGCPPPKLWKFPSPDEADLIANPRDRPTSDQALFEALPQGAYTPFSPFQPFHPVMPGLMISIIDPVYRHLLKHDENGKPKWNEVPEMARVSVRCLRTPGHTADSISLVMCEGEKGVFTGDTVLGQGTTVFTDLASYMTSLKTLLALKPSVLYPAHGPHLPTQEAATKHISTYITHRQDREDQIVALLQKLASDESRLREMMGDLMVKVKEDAAAAFVSDYQFISGKPYNANPPKAKDDKSKSRHANANVNDDSVNNGADEDPEAVARREKQAFRQSIVDKFPLSKGITTSLICRILYKTDKDSLVNAASKSVDAHLRKLEGEGKVRRVDVKLPAVTEGQIVEADRDTAGWEWAGEVDAAQIVGKIKEKLD